MVLLFHFNLMVHGAVTFERIASGLPGRFDKCIAGCLSVLRSHAVGIQFLLFCTCFMTVPYSINIF